MGETLTLRPWLDEDAAALVTAFAGVGMASQADGPSTPRTTRGSG